MLTHEFKDRLARTHIFLNALWLFLIAASIVAAGLPMWLFRRTPLEDNYEYLQALDEIIWALGIGTALLLVWSRSRFYDVEAVFAASNRPQLVEVVGDMPEEKAASRLVYFYRSKMLIAFGLAGSVAFYGILLALIEPGEQWRLFCVTAAALLVLFYPSRTFFDDLIKEYERRETMRDWR